MKTIILGTIFALGVFHANAGNKVAKIKTSAICDMCKNRIELVVNNIDGVKKSLLNLNTKIVKVKYNTDKTSAQTIRQSISQAGYNADDVKRNAEAYEVLPGCCKDGSTCKN